MASGKQMACSKYPPAFGIDLLVDDSAGVEIEGRRFGFSVVRVAPDDVDWVVKVERAVEEPINARPLQKPHSRRDLLHGVLRGAAFRDPGSRPLQPGSSFIQPDDCASASTRATISGAKPT